MFALIRLLGVINLLFAVFHVWLGTAIARIEDIPDGIHSLLMMLNAGGTLFILFLGLCYAFATHDVAETRLGRLVLTLGALTYLVRAAEELLLAPQISWAIFAVSLVTGLLHLTAIVRTLYSNTANGHCEHA